MAKTAYNPLSQWNGRVGGLVYKVVNGKQIVTPYSDKKHESHSTLQMSQRAKFALAGTISKIVPQEVLLGMSSDRRRRRPLFVSNIVRHAQVSVTDIGYTATLDAEDLVFSDGAYMPVTVGEVSASEGMVSGTVIGMDETVDAVMVIAVVYDTNVGLYTRTKFEVLPANDASFNLDTGISDTGNVAHLYAVPMSLSQLGLSLSGSSNGAERSLSNGYAYTLMMGTNGGSYTYGHSQYLSCVSLGEDTGENTGGDNSGGDNGNTSGGGGNSQTETVAAPVISGTTPFEETTQVTITGPDGAEIRYTTDGSTPTSASSLYSSALTLSDTTVVKATAIHNGVSSQVASQTFTKSSGGGGNTGGGGEGEE